MKLTQPFAPAFFLLVLASLAAQQPDRGFPSAIEAGSAFSIELHGSGQANLYIFGPNQVLQRTIQLGGATYFPAGSLYNAGHYSFLVDAGSQSQSGEFDVVPVSEPSELSFLAKPSRLPVNLRGGITGAIYVFDRYRNLIIVPEAARFELSSQTGNKQTRSVPTHDGAVWIAMDSTAQQGVDKFLAQVGGISSLRIIRQVPGEPCGIKMKARASGARVQLITDPVRDCNGNLVPDGTIVTFTETSGGTESTADVPLKQGFAQIEMPSRAGATISVASGTVLGNQIRWEQ